MPLSASIGRVPPIAAPRSLEGRTGCLFAGPGCWAARNFDKGPRAVPPSVDAEKGWVVPMHENEPAQARGPLPAIEWGGERKGQAVAGLGSLTSIE